MYVAELAPAARRGQLVRRRLTLVMVPGAALSLAVLGMSFVTGHSGRDSIALIVACLIAFMFFNAGGLQPMGWLTDRRPTRWPCAAPAPAPRPLRCGAPTC